MQQRDVDKGQYHVVFLTYSAVRHEETWQQSAFTTSRLIPVKCLAEKMCVWAWKVKGWIGGVAAVTLGEPNSRFSVIGDLIL